MLEHQKKVLLAVAAYPYLFKKELLKSLTWLSFDELMKLRAWTRKEFGSYYNQLIGEVFCSIPA